MKFQGQACSAELTQPGVEQFIHLLCGQADGVIRAPDECQFLEMGDLPCTVLQNLENGLKQLKGSACN